MLGQAGTKSQSWTCRPASPRKRCGHWPAAFVVPSPRTNSRSYSRTMSSCGTTWALPASPHRGRKWPVNPTITPPNSPPTASTLLFTSTRGCALSSILGIHRPARGISSRVPLLLSTPHTAHCTPAPFTAHTGPRLTWGLARALTVRWCRREQQAGRVRFVVCVTQRRRGRAASI